MRELLRSVSNACDEHLEHVLHGHEQGHENTPCVHSIDCTVHLPRLRASHDAQTPPRLLPLPPFPHTLPHFPGQYYMNTFSSLAQHLQTGRHATQRSHFQIAPRGPGQVTTGLAKCMIPPDGLFPLGTFGSPLESPDILVQYLPGVPLDMHTQYSCGAAALLPVWVPSAQMGTECGGEHGGGS